MKRLLMGLMLGMLLVSPLAAQELTGTLAQIDKSGKIRLGYQKLLPPMSFENMDGQPVGYTIDLCTQIVDEVEKKIGHKVSVEYVPVLSKNRFEALQDNRIDLLCGATTRTISRGEMVDFTQLTFVTGASFMTLNGTTVKDGFAGKKIGATEGTTTAKALKNLLEETGVEAEVVLMKSAKQGFKALNEGKVDVLTADQVVLIGLAILSGHPQDYNVLNDLFTYEPFALAVRRNDADFRLIADRVISELYRNEGILDIYNRWFGVFARTRSQAFDALIQINAIPE